MKKIIMSKKTDGLIIDFRNINENEPIFAKKDNKLIGMIVLDKEGWALHIGGSSIAYGCHSSLRDCIETAEDCEFYVEY